MGVGGPASRGRLSDVVLDFSRHGRESSLDILALLRGGLKEAHTVVVRHLLSLFESDLSSALQIGLVAHQDASDVVLSVLFNFAHPGVDGVEGIAVSDVIDDNDAVGALVVAGSNSLEALLAGRVPNLELADLVVNVDGTDLEVDADRGHEVLLELVVGESEEQAGLADA